MRAGGRCLECLGRTPAHHLHRARGPVRTHTRRAQLERRRVAGHCKAGRVRTESRIARAAQAQAVAASRGGRAREVELEGARVGHCRPRGDCHLAVQQVHVDCRAVGRAAKRAEPAHGVRLPRRPDGAGVRLGQLERPLVAHHLEGGGGGAHARITLAAELEVKLGTGRERSGQGEVESAHGAIGHVEGQHGARAVDERTAELRACVGAAADRAAPLQRARVADQTRGALGRAQLECVGRRLDEDEPRLTAQRRVARALHAHCVGAPQ
mmetsp:Transcript_15912/g.40628  ORF Transcript_15912/g.40628 Transcript_15912/m.40628 type:complete len:268 (-) Transcript_15912:707-1510(-)